MVYVMLADGFEEIEALTVVDVLRRGEVDVKTVSLGDNIAVTGAHSIIVSADVLFDEIDENIDMIVLPGGMPGTINLDNHAGLKNLLLKLSDKTYLAAICAAPMVFGKLGLLKNKKATCYPSFEKYLDGAVVSTDRVCVDGKIITSRGPGTALDFAMCIVSLLKDESAKKILCEGMLHV